MVYIHLFFFQEVEEMLFNIILFHIDQYSGLSFQSKKDYLFGKFDMQMKLLHGNFARIVTTFYVSLSYSIFPTI